MSRCISAIQLNKLETAKQENLLSNDRKILMLHL